MVFKLRYPIWLALCTSVYSVQGSMCKVAYATCTNSSCTECVPGYWGVDCENDCSNCKPGTACRKESGVCLESCVDGMRDVSCTTACDSECASCQRSYPYRCTACPDNKYGYDSYYRCYYDCSRNCVNSTCDDKTGECSFGCTDNYWGKQCRCPEHCYCDPNGVCTHCAHGYDNVNAACECTNEHCVDDDCSECKSSKYIVQNKTCCACHVFSNHCAECTSDVNGGFKDCVKCKTGFFLSNISNTCVPCPINCQDNSCEPFTGACNVGCKDFHWGTRCNKACESSCLQCDQVNGTCSKCQHGRYSTDCSKSCPGTCKTTADHVPMCDIVNGACLFGCCSMSVYGSHCQFSCSSNCSDQLCHRLTGHCLNGCIRSHYGKVCNNTCSPTCLPSSSGPRCHESNGACINGCEDGYYGEQCENRCGTSCDSMVCEQFTGLCLSDDEQQNNDDDVTRRDIRTAIISIGIGIILTIALATVVISVVIWKSRVIRNKTTEELELRKALETEDVILTNKTKDNGEKYK